MNNNMTSTIEILLEKAENYTRTSIELAKLNLVDKSSDVLSSLISRLAIAIVFVMFILLFNLGLSFWIGEMLGNFFYGFFIVSAFYLIICYYRSDFFLFPAILVIDVGQDFTSFFTTCLYSNGTFGSGVQRR